MKYYYDAMRKLIENKRDAEELVGQLHLRFRPGEETEDKKDHLLVYRPGYMMNARTDIHLRQVLQLTLRQLIREGRLIVNSILEVESYVRIGADVCTVFKWTSDSTRNLLMFTKQEDHAAKTWLTKALEMKQEDVEALAEMS